MIPSQEVTEQLGAEVVLTLLTSNIERSLHFYTTVCGFEVVRSYREPRFVVLGRAGGAFELILRLAEEADEIAALGRQGGNVDMFLRIRANDWSAVDAIVGATDCSAQYQESPFGRCWMVRDPDGNRISLNEYWIT
jgi:catechol 2,3-dioxygenase-like lactoylglutathione lyase family enzyme